MKLRNIARRTLQKVLVGIILVSLGIHLFSLYLGQSLIADFRWSHYPLHSSMEMAGAIIAFIVAFLLINLDKRNTGTSFNMRIAGALIGMGLLDGFHAVVMAGERFVWLHSLATFFGGLLFVLIWLPNRYFQTLNKFWPVIAGSLVTVLCFASIQFPGIIPPMMTGAGFTAEASILNVAGGVMFLVASLKLILVLQSHGRTDDLLFSVHCLLFGAAGLLFEQSRIWNVTWWGWHTLRLMAYGAALIFAIDTTLRDQRELRNRRETLEERVQERTEQLEKALEEKEMFLEETHHRVKNNMQIISSMISLQQNQVDDDTVKQTFEETLGRINSMALVHEFLYQSDDLAQLAFDEYVAQLVEELSRSHATADTDLTITTDVKPFRLSLDRAIRCGLILNELITNAFQHAFVNRDNGTIHITFEKSDEDYHLTVSDNGIGFNPDDTIGNDNSVGLNMVQTLVDIDLGGQLEINTDGGTTFRIEFPA